MPDQAPLIAVCPTRTLAPSPIAAISAPSGATPTLVIDIGDGPARKARRLSSALLTVMPSSSTSAIVLPSGLKASGTLPHVLAIGHTSQEQRLVVEQGERSSIRAERRRCEALGEPARSADPQGSAAPLPDLRAVRTALHKHVFSGAVGEQVVARCIEGDWVVAARHVPDLERCVLSGGRRQRQASCSMARSMSATGKLRIVCVAGT